MKRIITIPTVLVWLLLIPVFTISQQKTEIVSTVVTKYYDVKNALVNSDASATAKASADFAAFLKSADTKALPTSSQSTFKKIMSDANLIAASKDLEKQRVAFQSLSGNIISLAKASKLTQPAFVAYCPMKKASWLSSENKVKNPYYGNSMLTCGNITETLK